MSLDQAIGILVAVTLFEMMLATGFSVRLSDVTAAARDERLLLSLGPVNYVAVPIVGMRHRPPVGWRRPEPLQHLTWTNVERSLK